MALELFPPRMIYSFLCQYFKWYGGDRVLESDDNGLNFFSSLSRKQSDMSFPK